ncbi:hypothetical protein K437DRAFT_256910 [Tilletiaria anomala UBC 951]|uniref:Uncharacterized protein n=1 Tax=Tilletiaria anomala (strain ATCC 24038 / CBS 436.72 / UBC 951) TaxID=1037660 RepID=A0A066W1K8_TILAU|nr:uncharacterized protein K437DRAFT_256910 [Tilletiaria anomala UBC 951]KDN44680.1 hypothetical protein K437DRAFT_256910 [Tilletiaria anomala UBC 951]
MAPLPPFLVRLVSAYLTQALTRRLSRSPVFLHAVDRLIHFVDHLPARIEGKGVPPYQGPPIFDPRQRGEWGDAIKRPDDPGEPHDWKSPWSSLPKQAPSSQPASVHNAHKVAASTKTPRIRVRAHTAAKDAESEQAQDGDSQRERWAREMKELQDKLRGRGG